MIAALASLLLACAATSVRTSAAAIPEHCATWGFTSPSCNDCDSLASFVHDEELVDQCKQCCMRDPQAVIYSGATLSVPQHLANFPEVKKFIDRHAAQYKHVLKVSYSSSQWQTPPTLKLKLVGGGSDSLRVDNWKVAQFEEFLTARVKPAVKAAATA